jgi:hypothetical protein
MVAETGIRMVAVGKPYWSSLYNLVDFGILALCLICFLFIVNNECGDRKSNEAIAEEVLLIVRNATQLMRLGSMIKRNQNQMGSTRNINFDGMSSLGAHLLPEDFSISVHTEEDLV